MTCTETTCMSEIYRQLVLVCMWMAAVPPLKYTMGTWTVLDSYSCLC